MGKSSLPKSHKLRTDGSLDAIRKEGILVADDERYTINDLKIDELTLSLTELRPRQETRGHSHMDDSEIYFFTDGRGRMQVAENIYEVQKGSVILVPRGAFHKVKNLGKKKLLFVAVFTGNRASVNYNYNDRSLV